MQEPTASPVSAPASQNPRSPRLIAGALVLALILVVALVGFVRVDRMTLWERITMPRGPVTDVPVLLADRGFEAVSVYDLNVNGIEPRDFAEPIDDYAEGGDVRVMLRHLEGTTGSEVVLVDSGHVLTNDGLPKAALAVSPRGDAIAYAVLEPASGETAFVPNMAPWTIRVINLHTGQNFALGTGFGPQFFLEGDALRLMFTLPDGVVIADPYRGTASLSSFLIGAGIENTARISLDGTHIALRDPATLAYALYTVTPGEAALTFTPTGRVFEGMLDVALTSEGALGLTAPDEDGQLSIWKFPADPAAAPVQVASVSDDGFYRFIP